MSSRHLDDFAPESFQQRSLRNLIVNAAAVPKLFGRRSVLVRPLSRRLIPDSPGFRHYSHQIIELNGESGPSENPGKQIIQACTDGRTAWQHFPLKLRKMILQLTELARIGARLFLPL